MIFLARFLIKWSVNMMLLKKFSAFVLSSFCLLNTAYASQVRLCPDINRIKAEQISSAELISSNIYFTYNLSRYNTDKFWGFAIAPIKADSQEMAIEVANEVLSTITSQGVPDPQSEELVCLYDTGRDDIIAAAVDAEDAYFSINRLKHALQSAR